MTKQRFALQKPKAAVIPFVVGISLFVFLANAHAAAPAPCPLGTVFAALELLESVALAAASRAVQACIFNQQCLLQSLSETVTASWLLLAVIAVAILLRAAFARKVED